MLPMSAVSLTLKIIGSHERQLNSAKESKNLRYFLCLYLKFEIAACFMPFSPCNMFHLLSCVWLVQEKICSGGVWCHQEGDGHVQI